MKKSFLILVGTTILSAVVSAQNFFGDMPSEVSDDQMLDNYLQSHIYFCFDVNHDGYLSKNETKRLMQSYLSNPNDKCPGAATYIYSKLVKNATMF